MVELARRLGRAGDPHLRQELARLYTDTMTGLWNAQRGKAEARRGGGQAARQHRQAHPDPDREASGRGSATPISGAHGTLAGADGIDGGAFSKAMVFSPASSIYGGSDEIQRNIVAERTLGLPREPAPDKDRPYGEVLRGL